ncbi:MAG: hypothetical protein K2H60_15980 [Muribaculaceae bacterium]|nr:hypothetical protein [Muribaculaceae bacterium]
MIGIIYAIFIAAIMVGNGIYFGPCTIRQYCAIILFIYLYFNWSNIKGFSQIMPFYAMFIVLYGISALLENNIQSFIRQLVALYGVALLGYYNTILILKRYYTFNYFLNSFIVVGIINSIVTILQYLGIKYGYLIGAIFVDMNDEVKVAQLTRMMQGNHSNLMGIMGDIVYNGYYSMILPFFLLFRFRHLNWMVKYALLFLSLMSLFMVGERSCFGITLILLMYYLYIEFRNSLLFYFLCLFAFSGLFWLVSDIINSDIVQSSRWIGGDSGVRENINKEILPFIIEHFFLGGQKAFLRLTGFPPHNVIASGFIYSGILGGMCIVYILMKQVMIAYTLLKKHKNILITLAFMSYTLNGFFHNPAIVTGDAMVWIMWGMVYFSYKNHRKSIIKSNKCGSISFNLGHSTSI